MTSINTATKDLPTWHQPISTRDRLYGRTKQQAKQLQRKGMTFTEIAQLLGVERHSVVNTLFWEIAR